MIEYHLTAYGRTGNNYYQFINVFALALCCRARVSVQRDGFNQDLFALKEVYDFSNEQSPFSSDESECLKFGSRTGSFYMTVRDQEKWPNCGAEEYARDRYVNPLLLPACDKGECCPDDPDDSVVLHMRSDDIFANSPHAYYFPAPIVYYAAVLGHRPWSKITFVTEKDMAHPIIKLISVIRASNLIPDSVQVEVQSTDMVNDLLAMRCAKNFVMSSVSTFSVMAAHSSFRLERLYSPFKCFGRAGFAISLPDFDMERWRNDPAQVEALYTHSKVEMEPCEAQPRKDGPMRGPP